MKESIFVLIAGILFIVFFGFVFHKILIEESPYRYNDNKPLCESIGGTFGYEESMGGINTICHLKK